MLAHLNFDVDGTRPFRRRAQGNLESRPMGRHRVDDRRGIHCCARCDHRAGYLIGRSGGRSVWLCPLHYEVWAELRKSPARQMWDRMLWRIRH